MDLKSFNFHDVFDVQIKIFNQKTLFEFTCFHDVSRETCWFQSKRQVKPSLRIVSCHRPGLLGCLWGGRIAPGSMVGASKLNQCLATREAVAYKGGTPIAMGGVPNSWMVYFHRKSDKNG